MTLTDAEENLIKYMRAIEYGKIRLVIKGGEPVMITESHKDLKLT